MPIVAVSARRRRISPKPTLKLPTLNDFALQVGELLNRTEYGRCVSGLWRIGQRTWNARDLCPVNQSFLSTSQHQGRLRETISYASDSPGRWRRILLLFPFLHLLVVVGSKAPEVSTPASQHEYPHRNERQEATLHNTASPLNLLFPLVDQVTLPHPLLLGPLQFRHI